MKWQSPAVSNRLTPQFKGRIAPQRRDFVALLPTEAARGLSHRRVGRGAPIPADRLAVNGGRGGVRGGDNPQPSATNENCDREAPSVTAQYATASARIVQGVRRHRQEESFERAMGRVLRTLLAAGVRLQSPQFSGRRRGGRLRGHALCGLNHDLFRFAALDARTFARRFLRATIGGSRKVRPRAAAGETRCGAGRGTNDGSASGKAVAGTSAWRRAFASGSSAKREPGPALRPRVRR